MVYFVNKEVTGMGEFSRVLRELRLKRGLSQEKLAQILGTTKQVLSLYELGKRNPKVSTIQEWAAKLNVPEERLLKTEEEMRAMVTPQMLEAANGDIEEAFNFAVMMGDLKVDLTQAMERPLPPGLMTIRSLRDKMKVRLIGSVAAGQPIFAEENLDVYVDSPAACDYALKVQGDSMEPQYLNGDILYIKEAPDVPDGTVAVVLIDDSVTLKHVYHKPNGLQLISNNPKYAPIDVIGEEHDYIRILGVVCGFTRMFSP